MNPPRILEVRTRILKDNDRTARALRARFDSAGVTVVSLVSSPGAGKTELLEKTLSHLAGQYRVAALVGDLATDNDQQRLARSGAPVRQIVTGTVCHLEAAMIDTALLELSGAGTSLEQLDFLFIENVGNLVCPASYDLGEHLRLVLLSCTEGEDKPLKYPTIFNTADVAVLTKMDLADAVGFDRPTALAAIQRVRPAMRVIETSARQAGGLVALLDLLVSTRDRGATRNGEQGDENAVERASHRVSDSLSPGALPTPAAPRQGGA